MTNQSKRTGRTHNAQAARRAILEAAADTFAQHGFAGARIDTIAAAAGYNKSLIFQYFGDKLNLYAEVIKQTDQEATALRASVFAPLAADAQFGSDPHQLRAFLEAAFTAIFDHLLAHPRLRRMMLWEMAEGWQSYAQLDAQFQIEHPAFPEQLFLEAQQAGLLRATLSPTIQLTLALQICQVYLASLPLYQRLLPGADLASNAALAQARQQIVALIVAGILVDPPTT